MRTTKSLKQDTDDERARQVYVLMQPTRQKIIKVLREAKDQGKGLYIKEIAEKVGEPERNVSFHLTTLSENGFVKGEYREISGPSRHSAITGRAAKFYELTDKVEQVAGELAKIL